MILCGNKCDNTTDRAVFQEEAKQLAKANSMNYYDVSAKENLYIDDVFSDLMEQVAQRRLGGEAAPVRETIQLKAERPAEATAEGGKREKKSCGC